MGIEEIGVTRECADLGISIREVRNSFDVEDLRRLRNLTASGFSNDTAEISELAQRAWWVAMKGRVRAWLYWHKDPWNSSWPDDGTEVRGEIYRLVGFGVVRQTEDGRWWSSVGVSPHHTGHGYGGAITADLIRRAGGPVFATARRDNQAAIKLHRLTDWEERPCDPSEDSAKLIAFKTKPHVWSEQLEAPLAQWAESGWSVT